LRAAMPCWKSSRHRRGVLRCVVHLRVVARSSPPNRLAPDVYRLDRCEPRDGPLHLPWVAENRASAYPLDPNRRQIVPPGAARRRRWRTSVRQLSGPPRSHPIFWGLPTHLDGSVERGHRNSRRSSGWRLRARGGLLPIDSGLRAVPDSRDGVA
jgi:hypothetical protein